MCQKYYHNLGLGTKYVFLHVGWAQNLNLFLVAFILVSTKATWDSGTKILVLHTSGFAFRCCTLPFPWPNVHTNLVHHKSCDDSGGNLMWRDLTNKSRQP